MYHHRQNGGFIRYEHFLEKKISFAMLHRHYFNVLHVVQKMENSQNIKKNNFITVKAHVVHTMMYGKS